MQPDGSTAAAKAADGKSEGPTSRNKVPLGVGLSHTSWMQIVNSGQSLTGLPVGETPRKVSRSELQQHNTREDAWMALNGHVFNVTAYVRFHPGGVEEIMRGVGDDATDLFQEYHPWVNAPAMLKQCYIGPLVPDAAEVASADPSFVARRALQAAGGASGGGIGFSSAAPDAAAGAAFGPSGTASAAMRVGGGAGIAAAGGSTSLKLLSGDSSVWHRVRVLYSKPLSADGSCVLIRCALSTRKQRLGLDYAGQHIRVRVPDEDAASGEGKPYREFTPVSALQSGGFFDLAVKVYAQGKVSAALGQVKEDSVIEVSGPRGAFRYNHGVAMWGGTTHVASALCMAGGGSGVTPLLQIAKCIADDKSDKTPAYFAVSHSSSAVSMLNRDFANLAMQCDNIHVAFFSTSESSASDSSEAVRLTHERIKYYDGQRITQAALQEFWPAPTAKTVVAWCGPPGFNQHIDDTVRDMYYLADNCFSF